MTSNSNSAWNHLLGTFLTNIFERNIHNTYHRHYKECSATSLPENPSQHYVKLFLAFFPPSKEKFSLNEVPKQKSVEFYCKLCDRRDELRGMLSFTPSGHKYRKMYRCKGERINQHFLEYVNRYLAPINYFQPKGEGKKDAEAKLPCEKVKSELLFQINISFLRFLLRQSAIEKTRRVLNENVYQ